jgi:hypothetical protein
MNFTPQILTENYKIVENQFKIGGKYWKQRAVMLVFWNAKKNDINFYNISKAWNFVKGYVKELSKTEEEKIKENKQRNQCFVSYMNDIYEREGRFSIALD